MSASSWPDTIAAPAWRTAFPWTIRRAFTRSACWTSRPRSPCIGRPIRNSERTIGLDPAFYLQHHLEVQCQTPGAVTPEALSEYLRCYCCQSTIHAICEDYRAAAGIDLEMDEADDQAGRKITAPVLGLWGATGTVGRLYDVLATWREKSIDVSGRALDCGHLLPEERPEEVLAELRAFFR
jgi:haloacetate dehalogenase